MAFGNTWWGEQWLMAMNMIDHSNRLPRGRTYANRGAVTAVKITDTRIEAKVQGIRKRPYTVTVIFPSYKEEQIAVIMRAIKDNPLILDRLLNRELPRELMAIAEDNNIPVFPSNWKDMYLNCSCPDWAMPCKHLAALIFTVAAEIDKNPFLVFKLHHLNILERLRYVENTQIQPVFNFSRIMIDKKRRLEPFVRDEAAFEALDFSVIPELGRQIVSLYPHKASFFGGDIQALFARYYRIKLKGLDKETAVDASAFRTIRHSRINLIFAVDDTPSLHFMFNAEDRVIEPACLCSLLNETSIKHIYNYSAHFAALYFIFHYCKRLLRQGAFLPQLTETGEYDYRIRWTPALIDKNVRSVFDTLLRITPPDICLAGRMSRNGRTVFRRIPPEENLKALCAYFLDFYFKSDTVPASYAGHRKGFSHNVKVTDLFFCRKPQPFRTSMEKDIPEAIKIWLSRFNLTRKKFVPVLAIDEFPQRFECRVLVEESEQPMQPPVALSDFFAGDELLAVHIEMVRDLSMLAGYMPELNDILRTAGRSVARFDNLTVVGMLEKTLPVLELFGIRVLLPKSLQQIVKPQLSMKIRKQARKSYLTLEDLLAFDWRIAFGDYLITEEEFMTMSRKAGQLIRLKDRYAVMTESEIKRIIKSLSAPRDVRKLNILQSVLSEEFEGAKVEIDDELREEIRRLLREEDVELPQGLEATLRPYQRRGFNWMYKNARLGLGSVLADDMGLGKTLQVITTLLKFKEEGRLGNGQPAIVIAPATLLANWEREIRRFAPLLTYIVYHGPGRGEELSTAMARTDIVLTSYGIIRSDATTLRHTEWAAVIIDEAQNIKNEDTAQSKAVKQLRSRVKIAMSGTPVENRLAEYWSIFDFTNSGYLGNLSFFNDHFAKPIEQNHDHKKSDSFRKITQPFVMRRLKNDKSIIDDLPDKIETNQYCILTPEQISLYRETVEKNLRSVQTSEGIQRQGLVLTLLNSLKQICNHPSHFLKRNDYSPALSGKAGMLFHLLDNIYEAGEKALIFTQYAEMGEILAGMIDERYGKKPLFLHGGRSLSQRDIMVSGFQNRPEVDTFILSLKAGGTGLNLTAAANVIHYDLWWNPAVESQATDRAFRIGQHRNVMVHRLITKNTLEEKIDAMIQDKKSLAGITVATGESWIGNLSDKELQELVALGY
ncbi:MAG: DEAD/DEAH box helicase [Tannerellaceae bacterium]|jgi:SNF2 family DNA or RNA helicase|nr:DEAD/DEAH box helicase [Tannerellaceae bacterium]